MIKRVVIFNLMGIFLLANFGVSAKTVIRFQDWHMNEEVWLKCLKEIKADYEKLHPEVDVLFEPVANMDKVKKFSMGSEARNAPDVIHCESFDLPLYFSKGYLLDLNPFIKKEGKGFLKQWVDSAVKLGKYRGKQYVLPDDDQSIVLFYNPELFEQAGLDPNKPPQTWTEFRDYAIKLTNHKDQWGFGMVGKTNAFVYRFLPVLWSFGGDIFDAKMTKCLLDSPDSIAAFKFYVELCTKDGVTPPAPTEMESQDVRTFFAQEKVAMKFGSGWTISIVNKINPSLKAPEVLRCAPMPVGKKKATYAVIDYWGISVFTRNKKAAWSWVKYLTSKNVTQKMFKDNGVTSSRIDVGESDLIKNDKFASVVSSQMRYGRPLPMFMGINEVNDVMIVAIQEALTKQKTPEAAVKEAAGKINGILVRYKKAK